MRRSRRPAPSRPKALTARPSACRSLTMENTSMPASLARIRWTYEILPGCTLKFIQDVTAAGLNGGQVLDMWVHEHILVASFQDGSIESFNVAGGVPVPNGDLQYSTGHTLYNSAPSGVDITADGHYAVFGGTNVPRWSRSRTFPPASWNPRLCIQTLAAVAARRRFGSVRMRICSTSAISHPARLQPLFSTKLQVRFPSGAFPPR
jgi:hypothetical protein